MRIIILISALCCYIASFAQIMPYKDANLTPEERAQDLLSRLTLKEKVGLMGDNSIEVTRLGVKKFAWWSEALHGVANQGGVTVFPEPIGMAASFNDELLYHVFDAISDEARAIFHFREKKGDERRQDNGLSVWTPNVNIFRDPRWGRGQETYGEDPYLTSRMGISVVNGLQGPKDAKYKKLLACAKHYAVHSGPEWNRHVLNLNNLDNRHLWETYMPAFQVLVQKADVSQVMCAYHRQDDDPCCGNNHLLKRILRDEWGFKRMVVSDCGAIADFYTSHKVSSDALHSAVKGVLAGTDVECGFGYTYHELVDAVSRGLIYEADIDKSVLRLLTERFRLGDFDDNSIVPWANIPDTIINCKKHQALALEMARQSMTLLQNKNNILPLSSKKKIAVIGPNADDAKLMWGNYNGIPVKTVTILEGIKSIAGKDIFYEKGCDIVDDMILESYITRSTADGKTGIKATYWNNKQRTGDAINTIQYDKPMRLSTTGQHPFADKVNLQNFSAVYETSFIAPETEEIVFKIQSVGDCQLFINNELVSEYSSWRFVARRTPYKVEKGKQYDIKINFTQNYDFTNANLNFDMGKESPVDYKGLVNRLKDIDVVVFAGGISGELEGEEMPIEMPGFKGGDRTDIELPASQRNCIKALKKAGKRVIMVNCSGSAIGLMPESESCEAILQAWYGGQSGGQAIAEVLFGKYNPSGKLPITFYENIDQLPDFEEYDMKGRTYRYLEDKPLFPFGYGLSYTTFDIGRATASSISAKAGEKIKLVIPVKNTGKRTGSETVQVYVKKVDSGGPIKTLRSFKRIELPPNVSQDLTFELEPSFFEWYDPATLRMNILSGDYEILYGTSSDNKDLQTLNITLI
ncbi:xylan 1,4-beta-xylosidase [Dysgonomonas termitidis]|uniref:Xylan 1,4-beta-xylosidase n=1 Tax=Dysgonomonas termitidis TaxID=1516126 RepID=A0ABV9KRA4_9BACT